VPLLIIDDLGMRKLAHTDSLQQPVVGAERIPLG
jgi:hypothetical protein